MCGILLKSIAAQKQGHRQPPLESQRNRPTGIPTVTLVRSSPPNLRTIAPLACSPLARPSLHALQSVLWQQRRRPSRQRLTPTQAAAEKMGGQRRRSGAVMPRLGQEQSRASASRPRCRRFRGTSIVSLAQLAGPRRPCVLVLPFVCGDLGTSPFVRPKNSVSDTPLLDTRVGPEMRRHMRIGTVVPRLVEEQEHSLMLLSVQMARPGRPCVLPSPFDCVGLGTLLFACSKNRVRGIDVPHTQVRQESGRHTLSLQSS